jgi:hypothetical protein
MYSVLRGACKYARLPRFDESTILRPAMCCSGIRTFSNEQKPKEETSKPTLVARFKQMYKDYWYVLVPVHLVTSACWIGGFYYLAKRFSLHADSVSAHFIMYTFYSSGVDVVAVLKSAGVSDRFTDPIKDSSMGHLAVAYAMYKIATPLRYTITLGNLFFLSTLKSLTDASLLGGTTISIKYLQLWGYIKPMPSAEKLKEMYQETKQELRHRKYQIKERKDNMMSDIAKYKQEMDEIKKGELKNK